MREIDQLHRDCYNCKEGTFEEYALESDWHGVLKCTSCGYLVKRYAREYTMKDIAELDRRSQEITNKYFEEKK